MKIAIKSITRDELVLIFSNHDDYTMGGAMFSIDVLTNPKNIKQTDFEYLSEFCAQVLLDGGKLIVTFNGEETDQHIFDLSLAKRRLGKEIARRDLVNFLMGDCDYWTYYNLMQVIAIGDIVYE